jgi:hypothetical protein
LIVRGFGGLANVEDLASMIREHPLYDEYWESKKIDNTKMGISRLTLRLHTPRDSTRRVPSRGFAQHLHPRNGFETIIRKSGTISTPSQQMMAYRDSSISTLKAFKMAGSRILRG